MKAIACTKYGSPDVLQLREVAKPDMPPKNCTSYDVRKTKPVKRGDLDGKEKLHTGTDHQ